MILIFYCIDCKVLAPKLTEVHNAVSLIAQENTDVGEKIKKINTYLSNKVIEGDIQDYDRTDLLYEVDLNKVIYRFTLSDGLESTDEVTTGVHRGG